MDQENGRSKKIKFLKRSLVLNVPDKWRFSHAHSGQVLLLGFLLLVFRHLSLQPKYLSIVPCTYQLAYRSLPLVYGKLTTESAFLHPFLLLALPLVPYLSLQSYFFASFLPYQVVFQLQRSSQASNSSILIQYSLNLGLVCLPHKIDGSYQIIFFQNMIIHSIYVLLQLVIILGQSLLGVYRVSKIAKRWFFDLIFRILHEIY